MWENTREQVWTDTEKDTSCKLFGLIIWSYSDISDQKVSLLQHRELVITFVCLILFVTFW